MVVGVVLVMTVPLLYRIIGSRFVELFTGVNDADYDLHTSTGQRMAVAAAFKEHFWEAPLIKKLIQQKNEYSLSFSKSQTYFK